MFEEPKGTQEEKFEEKDNNEKDKKAQFPISDLQHEITEEEERELNAKSVEEFDDELRRIEKPKGAHGSARVE